MGQLDGIDVFVKVIQAGSFTGAAKLLNMPVTTVSGKIRELERRLGVTLIHRTTRKLSITESGQTYFKHCLTALNEVTTAENALKDSKAEPEGLLRITAAPDLGHAVLPPLVKKYLAKYPKVKIELILTNRMIDLVGESVDLALRAGPMKDSTLITKKFKETEGSLWASSQFINKHGAPKNISELEKYDFLGFKIIGNKLKFTDGKKTATIQISPRITLDDMEAVKIFVLADHGIGIMPSIICEQEIKSGKLVQLLPEWRIDIGPSAKVVMSFVYPPHRFVPAKVKAFIELAVGNLN
ncbi:MAG: LysR family transcriptional regulator [Bdellovibrionales bacterium]|nr:LysR family transcriptional regulator [Bdellovibrionales bacterium]